MGQNPRLCGTLIEAWRFFQADQALKALEGQFDAPAQAVKSKHIAGGISFGCKRLDRKSVV